MAGGVVSIECSHLPREQFLDAVDGMLGEAGEHLAEVLSGIEAVEFRAADQAIEDGGAFAALIRTGEEVILASQATARRARSAALLSISRLPSSA